MGAGWDCSSACAHLVVGPRANDLVARALTHKIMVSLRAVQLVRHRAELTVAVTVDRLLGELHVGEAMRQERRPGEGAPPSAPGLCSLHFAGWRLARLFRGGNEVERAPVISG